MKQRVLPNVHKALSPFVSDYEPIVRLLQQVKGPANVQKYVIQHAIKEAVRYETMTRFSILNSQWNGHKVHKELNFDFYPLSSISVSDLFATSLIVFFFLPLWQIQKTCSDPAASDHLCWAGEEGLGAPAAYQQPG